MLIHFILNTLYLIALLLASPFLIYRIVIKGKYWRTLRERLGGISSPTQADIWLHGVSVGEIKAAYPLIEKFQQEKPHLKIVVSSTSSRGLEMARNLYPDIAVMSFPLDFSWVIKRLLKEIQPKLIILMELELWPNFLFLAKKKDIPVILMNGRVSEKSGRRYSYIKWAFCKATQGICYFSVQSSVYAKRLEALGISSERIEVTGNIKFDAIEPKELALKQKEIAEQLHLRSKDLVLVAGSTHWPEEKFILEAYSKIVTKLPKLRLILVPRHPERAMELCSYIEKSDFSFTAIRKSKIHSEYQSKKNEVIIGDIMGELAPMYTVAHLVFIGGSLIPHGGQNFIEPASLGKAVICGPYMANFPDLKLFREENAIRQLSKQEDLAEILESLLKDSKEREMIGGRAARLVKNCRGSVTKNYELAFRLLNRK